MEFQELVREAERTGGKVVRIKAEQYNLLHQAQANAILDYIKDCILTKAGEKKLSRGVTEALEIPDKYVNSFGITQKNVVKCYGNLLGNLREMTVKTFSVQDSEQAISVFNALKSAARPDGITISDPYILATIFKHIDEEFEDEEIIGYKKFPIHKKKLHAEMKTNIHRKRPFLGMPYGDWHGEKAVLSLAVDYTYND